MDIEETIVAIASSHTQQALRGVVRVSGPGTLACVQDLFAGQTRLHPTRAARYEGRIQLAAPLLAVPCDLHLWPTSRSYTCQPLAEFHTIGARPILEGLLEALVAQPAVRLARPGEFTLRAFLAGRIDLAQAEAVLGVIDAASDRQLQVALEQLAGGLSLPLAQLRESLLNLCADLEAGLDFVDEDIEFVSQAHVCDELTRALAIARRTLEQLETRRLVRSAPRVVLRGEPNAGKSSLFNALAQGAALVTDQAGTTRDYLTAQVEAPGGRFLLVDTAGIEAVATALDGQVRQQADHQASHADLVVLCVDASRPLSAWEREEMTRIRPTGLVVGTKCDLATSDDGPAADVDVVTSAHRRIGLEMLKDRIGEALATTGEEASVVGSTATRCRASLEDAAEALARGHHLAANALGEELVAAEIRLALDHLGLVVGSIYTDDILDRVFSRFCIGK